MAALAIAPTPELTAALDALRQAQDQQAKAMDQLIALLRQQKGTADPALAERGRIVDIRPGDQERGSHLPDDLDLESGSVSKPARLEEFQLHYQVDTDGLVELLRLVSESLSSHTYLHDWDRQFRSDPVALFVGAARLSLVFSKAQTASHIAEFSSVNRVHTRNGVSRRVPVTTESPGVREIFFLPESWDWPSESGPQRDSRAPAPKSAFGRVVLMRETMEDAQRAVLLSAHAFCIRLQEEDPTFIRNFLSRHLGAASAYVRHSQTRDTSPSTNPLISYKRVSFSFHLSHLLVDRWTPGLRSAEMATHYDRQCIRTFGSRSAQPGGGTLALYRASSSVLLTLAVPQETSAHEEYIDILENPALWNVLVVNVPSSVVAGFRQEPLAYLTPLAQFCRGIAISVMSQRLQLNRILAELRSQLPNTQHNDGGEVGDFSHDIFDDSSFSKSSLYHRLSLYCHELSSSVESNLKFVQAFQRTDLVLLRSRAHAFEKPGVQHWCELFANEITNLEQTGEEIRLFREQVRELRDALHGATALLESRNAFKQGAKVQLLSYLALAYLPLSTVAGLYSMSVLPDRTTFYSFFIVLVGFFLATILLAGNIQHLASFSHASWSSITTVSAPLIRAVTSLFGLPGFLASLYSYEHTAINTSGRGWLAAAGLRLFVAYPSKELLSILRSFTPPPRSPFSTVHFSLTQFVIDVFRICLLPVWLSLGVVGLGMMAVRALVRLIIRR